jgi:ATP synthase F0 subunit b
MDPIIVAAADAGGAYGVILPAPGELLWGAVAFTIVFVILSKLAFPALGRVLDDRAAAIQGKMEEADAKLVEAEEARRTYEASVADARGEANRIIEDAKVTAEQLRADILARAEVEATGMLERAQADIVRRARPGAAGAADPGRRPVGGARLAHRRARTRHRDPPGAGRRVHPAAVQPELRPR